MILEHAWHLIECKCQQPGAIFQGTMTFQSSLCPIPQAWITPSLVPPPPILSHVWGEAIPLLCYDVDIKGGYREGKRLTCTQLSDRVANKEIREGAEKLSRSCVAMEFVELNKEQGDSDKMAWPWLPNFYMPGAYLEPWWILTRPATLLLSLMGIQTLEPTI